MALNSTTASDGATVTPAPAISEQDNFFALKPTNYTYTNSYNISFSPSSTITDHKIVFEIPKLSTPNVAFLNDMVLHLMLKLEDKDQKKPAAGTAVAPLNLFPSQMFRSCRLYIQDVEVSSDNGFYGWRSYMSFLTGLDMSSKNSGAQCNAFYMDRANEFQVFDSSANGFLLRQLLFGELKKASAEEDDDEAGAGLQVVYYDKAMPFFSKVVTDWSSCSLPLIPDCSARVEFELAPPAYYMLCRENLGLQYRLSIKDCSLILPVKTLSTGLALDLEKRMNSAPLVFPLSRLESRKISIPASVQSYTTENLVQGVNPDRIMLLLIPQYLYEDAYDSNPTELRSSWLGDDGTLVSLVRTTLSLNGQPMDVGPMGSNDKMNMTAFRQFYNSLGQLDRKGDAGINFAAFTQGYFTQIYDLSASCRAYDNDQAKQPTKTGHVRLELNFSGPLQHPLYLISMAEYPSSCSISKNRTVTYSYLA